MSTKIEVPKSNIKKSLNLATQATFNSAVSDIVNATLSLESGKDALVDAVVDFLTDLQGVLTLELTYADRGLLRDTLVVAYSKKMPDDEEGAKRLATKQWGDVKAVLVKKYDIVFLDKETKVAKDKAKSREVKKEVTVNRVDRVKQIRKNNPKLSNADAVIQLNKNIVDASGTALSETQQKDLLKAVEDDEFNLSAKRELLKIIKPRFIFDKDHQQDLKDLDINLLIEVEQLARKLRKA
jgi:hypothetical protein